MKKTRDLEKDKKSTAETLLHTSEVRVLYVFPCKNLFFYSIATIQCHLGSLSLFIFQRSKTFCLFVAVKCNFPFSIHGCWLIFCFGAQVLEFDWRSAFRGLVPHMAHCVKVVLDDVCTKSLQQEEALHSSGHTLITLSNITASNTHLREDSFYTYPERETPRMIGKVLGYFNYFKCTVVIHCYMIP